MTEKINKDSTAGASKAISRRNFIKGVIAGGAAVIFIRRLPVPRLFPPREPAVDRRHRRAADYSQH